MVLETMGRPTRIQYNKLAPRVFLAIRLVMQRFWPIVCIIFLGFLSQLWFKATVLAGGDQGFPPNQGNLLNVFYVWNNHGPWLGSPVVAFSPNSPPPASIFPYALFWIVLSHAGFSLSMIDRAWVYLLFTLPGGAMYYLTYSLGIRSKMCRLASSVLYMINPYLTYAFTIDGPMNTSLMLFYSCSPILLGLFIRGISQNNMRYSIFIGLFSLFASAVFENPPRYVLLWFLPGLYVFWELIRGNLHRATRFLFLTALIVVFINIFWLVDLPTIFGFANNGLNASNTLQYLRSFSGNSNVLSSLNMVGGGWAWNQGAYGSPYYPFANVYYSIPLLLLATGISSVALSSLLLSRKPILLFLGTSLFISVFFALGPHPPLGNLFLFLYNRIPGFYIFRVPYDDFEPIVVLLLSALTGFAVESISCWRIQWHPGLIVKAGNIFVIAIIIFALIAGWPILTGAVMPSSPRGGTGSLPGFQVNVPSYWLNFERFSESINNPETHGRILLVPPVPYAASFNWSVVDSLYGGTDPALSLSLGSYLETSGVVGSNSSTILTTALYNCNSVANPSEIHWLLNLLNVEYVLYRASDLLNYSYNAYTAQCWNNILTGGYNFSLIGNWGPLILYKNDMWRQALIYAANNLSVFMGNLKGFENLSALRVPSVPSSGYIIPSQNSALNLFEQNVGASRLIRTITVNVKVEEGSKSPINWATLGAGVQAVYRQGWTEIVSTEPVQNSSVLECIPQSGCPYVFPAYSDNGWGALNSTLVYFDTNQTPILVESVNAANLSVSNIVGVWWQESWMGMGTRPIAFPVLIPPHQKVVIQIGERLKEINLTLLTVKKLESSPLGLVSTNFTEINPTKYVVHIHATSPYLLVFSTTFAKGWAAYIQGSVVPDHDHVVVNGYANGWLINKTGSYSIVIAFLPQTTFYYGVIVSAATVGVSILYLFFAGRKSVALNRQTFSVLVC